MQPYDFSDLTDGTSIWLTWKGKKVAIFTENLLVIKDVMLALDRLQIISEKEEADEEEDYKTQNTYLKEEIRSLASQLDSLAQDLEQLGM